MENQELIQQVNKKLAIELPEKISFEELKSKLAVHINYMIQNDFEKLISLLYRIDVSETKIKSFLEQQTEIDAGNIIATLIIERELEKIKSRKQFNKRDNNFNGEEKW